VDQNWRWIRVVGKYGNIYHLTEHINMLRTHES
jgi:hypothetical protein